MARRRKEVSEKSLELNVGAELIQCIRTWPNCTKALWYGLTQTQEKDTGLDEFVCNVPHNLLLMLQFKSPRAASSGRSPYIFDINLDQYQTLLSLAVQFPQNVYYVFPLYREWGKAGRDAPFLAQDTWLMPVSFMPPSSRHLQPPSSYATRGVVVDRKGSNISVRYNKDEVTGKAFSVQQYCANAPAASISRRQLQAWAQEVNQSDLDQRPQDRPVRNLCAVLVS